MRMLPIHFLVDNSISPRPIGDPDPIDLAEVRYRLQRIEIAVQTGDGFDAISALERLRADLHGKTIDSGDQLLDSDSWMFHPGQLPWFMGTTDDGREWLVNHQGIPLWVREKGKPARRAEPHDRPAFRTQTMLHLVGHAPEAGSSDYFSCVVMLDQWNVRQSYPLPPQVFLFNDTSLEVA